MIPSPQGELVLTAFQSQVLLLLHFIHFLRAERGARHRSIVLFL
jgi:hypothetical protein